MLESLLSAKKVGSPTTGEYTFLGEEAVGLYPDLNAASAQWGSGFGGNIFLKYYSHLEDKNCYIPKKVISINGITGELVTKGLAVGKEITFNKRRFFCRLIRGANTDPINSMPAQSDVTVYPNVPLFAFSEFNWLFNPIVNMAGTSPEGMVYGSAAKYALADLGFGGATNGNATICGNYRTGQMLLRGSSNQLWAGMRSQSQQNAYWAYRPILFEL